MESSVIVKILESLSTELSGFRTEVSKRFDALDSRLAITAARLDRQGGLLQAGTGTPFASRLAKRVGKRAKGNAR